MGKKRYTPEQIIEKLREAEVVLAQGLMADQVCCPVLQLFSVGSYLWSHKQLFKLVYEAGYCGFWLYDQL